MESMSTVKWFIGFDQVEAVAYHTLCHSIISRSTIPVEIIPIKRSMLQHIHSRPLDKHQSNEFSFTRFLVPYLCGYEGYAIFTDCDMLMRVDVKELISKIDQYYAVQVVKHDYEPKNDVKYLGTKQYAYPRKNWSSVMLFNCSHSDCKQLTPDYVNSASGLDLHRFKWARDSRIGELDKVWNHLVSEYAPNPNAKIVHWTVGGPYFNEYENCEFSDEWFIERALMNNCLQRDKLIKTG